ncbi:MAG: homocysteine S-methyltransferase family protein, partial [Lachnospiraceae bacterium]|nr:homocysteine S-methyltransferase family protein [Lachnospiraceae bacterium]
MKLRDRLGKEWLFFDGGSGTLLQSRGLKGGEQPELWNLSRPQEILSLHRQYLDAGADIIETNTFGANRFRFGAETAAVIHAGVKLARKARADAGREEDAYVALDIGPTGKLLKPMGDLDFEDAVDAFAEAIRYGAEA